MWRENNFQDFCELFGPKCGKCQKTIMPVDDTGVLVRVESDGQEFHLACFDCDTCGRVLSEERGAKVGQVFGSLVLHVLVQAYPLDGLRLCGGCHVRLLHLQHEQRQRGSHARGAQQGRRSGVISGHKVTGMGILLLRVLDGLPAG